MSTQKIWLVGVGAIGSIVAGKLRSAPPCRLIDGWTEHIQTIRREGLQVDYQDETARVSLPAFHLSEIVHIKEEPDLILLAVKANSTVEVLKQLLPYMTDKTLVVSLQNGINEEAISRLIGSERTIGAMVSFGGELVAPGKARGYGGERHLVLGALDGSLTPRLEWVAESLSSSVRVEMTTNIWGELWSKLVVNAQMNAVSALTGLQTNEVAADPVARRVALSIAKEAVGVALRLGVTLHEAYLDGPPESYLRGFDDEVMCSVERKFISRWGNGGVKPSMLQDREKGRATEIDFLNGYVVEKARAVNAAAPVNEAIVRLIKAAEAEGRRPGRESLMDQFSTVDSRLAP
jgi:2-dehydropantoate 2-reductase